MANLRNDGYLFDAGLIIETGATITAGSMIWADVSGTNVVHAVRLYSGTTPATSISGTAGNIASLDTFLQSGVFLGVIARTQTGAAGSQTGVSWYTEGVFEFNTTPTASSAIRVGYPVYAINADTVRSGWTGVNAGLAGSNITGLNPIGVCSFIPAGGVINTGTPASRVRVKIHPHRTMQSFA